MDKSPSKIARGIRVEGNDLWIEILRQVPYNNVHGADSFRGLDKSRADDGIWTFPVSKSAKTDDEVASQGEGRTERRKAARRVTPTFFAWSRGDTT